MKKIHLFPVLAVLIALTACQDDLSTTGQTGLQGITATIANEEDAATRAVMVDAPTQAINLRWTAGDAIGVFDAANSNTRYEAAAADISADSTQAVFRANGAVPQAAFLAYYPYDAQSSGNATELHLNMPAKQQYVMRNFNTEPDAKACMMVGSGYANSVDFRNVSAILKVGYVPRDSDVVTAVVFRDLTGQPVSGAFTVTIDNDGKPVATYPASGNGQTIMLDCGGGVSVVPTIVSNFFLVVPARDYAKGFQLDFQLASGKTDVRTIGKRAGKVLQRSMVYNVGDVSTITKDDYQVVFAEGGGVIMDDDMLAMVNAVKPLGQIDAEAGYGTYYDLICKPGIGLKEGMTVVINRLSEALPYGLTAKVVGIKDLGMSQQVRVMQYAHAEEAFQKLLIGSTDAINADGSPNMDRMLPLDLTSHFVRFVPAEGMEGMTVEMTDDGLVLTDNAWPSSAPITRAMHYGELKFPHVALNYTHTPTDRVSFGAQPAIKAGIGAAVTDKHLDYVAFSLTPTLTLDISVEKTIELADFCDREQVLGEMMFTPITVGPVVLIPVFKVSGFVSVKGELKLTAKWSYTLGFNVAASYQNSLASSSSDTGWVFRCSNQCQGIPSLADLLMPSDMSASAILTSKLGLIFDVGLSFFAIVDFTLYTKIGMDLSASLTLRRYSNMSLSLTPITEAGAAVGLIGTNPKRRNLLQVDWNPWWVREIYPEIVVMLGRQIENPPRGSMYYPAYPVNEIDEIGITANLMGYLLEDCHMQLRVTKKSINGTSDEVLVASYNLEKYPASNLLFADIPDDPGDLFSYQKVQVRLPKSLFFEENYIYYVHVYATSDGAAMGQNLPSANTGYSSLGYVEITRKKDVWRGSRSRTGEYLLINDDASITKVNDDGEIIIKSRYGGE